MDITVLYTTDEVAAQDLLVDYAAKNWGWYIFGGIASILFGFVIMSFKFETALAFAIFVGIFFIGLGVIELMAAFRVMAHKWLWVLAGLLSIAGGIVLLAWPNITLFVLAILIGWTLMFWGIADIVGSLVGRRVVHYWWLYLIRGIVSIALGIWALRHPGDTLVVLIAVVGIWAVLYGTLEIVAGFEMKGAKRRWEAVKREAAQ
jgi:uncharacterized membrane protein HdeD (DUF308 family)